MNCCCVSLEIIDQPCIELEIFSDAGGRLPPYEGPYIVIPKTVDQYLATNNKTMTDDVTVTEIPYAEVGNQYGTTVTIAS